jgi:hypothetical protein
MKPNSTHLIAAVRQAEIELDAAKGRSALNAAAQRLMRARAALKEAEQQASTRRASGGRRCRPNLRQEG